jgi:hypothetical protein
MEASAKLCHAVCVQNEGPFVSELASFGGSEQGARGWCLRGTATRSREGKTERPILNQFLRRVREQVLDTVHDSRVAENNFIKGGEYAMPMAAHEERLTTTLAVIAAWARVLEFHSQRAPACH